MEYLYKPLSDRDLDILLDEFDPRTANIQTYDDIVKHNDAGKIFKDKDYCIIFIKNKNSKIGHWVITFKTPNKQNEVNYFDSYSFPMSKSVPKLPNILFQNFDTIKCNKTAFQDFNTAPCGRYCLFVYCVSQMIPNFDMTHIKKILDMLKKPNQTYDNLICELVNKDL